MAPIIFFFICFGIWYLWIKLSPNHSSMIKIKFDYVWGGTSFYSKGTVIAAVAFWIFLLIVGIAVSDFRTTVIILGLITLIYLGFIVSYLVKKNKTDAVKKDAIKLPGKIVGMKRTSYYSYSGKNPGRKYTYYLIVEYGDPYTGQIVEYITPSVNGNPYYYLRSLDVTVYYRDAENIWVDDFKRIKKLRDNVAYQLTGSVDGKMPDDFRIEEIERTN